MGNKLESLLRPLLRVGTRMELRRASSPLPRATSKFGGTPFATRDETWPPCAECHRPLSFIGQVDLRQTASGGSVQFDLFQFFHCWECYPWGDDGKPAWLVRTYRAPESLEAADLPVPRDPHALRECQVRFQRGQFLPDWEAADSLCPEAIQAASEIDPDDTVALYEQVAGKVAGRPQVRSSRVGGYPYWIQHDATPDGMRFLAQIDSEGEADCRWGDDGSVYLFVSETIPYRFVLRKQCY